MKYLYGVCMGGGDMLNKKNNKSVGYASHRRWSRTLRLYLGLLIAPVIALSVSLSAGADPLPTPWVPKPNIAVDTGNWTSVDVQKLLIRRDGFSGYFTRGFLGSEQLKSYHPQHVVRLPNKEDANGNMRAYFAVTQ